MDFLYRVPVLRIKQCPDGMRWYRDLVGQLVPHRSWSAADGFMSAEQGGFTNFVRTADAEPVEVLVRPHELGQWPYSQSRHKAVAVHPGALDWPETAMRTAAMPKTCAGSCDRMGICQALDGCQDQARIDTQLASPAPLQGQSRAHSMAETLASISVGFVVSMVIQAVVLPAFGHHITLAENFWITCIFTVASVLRGYAMRRLFNRIHKKAQA